MLLNCDRGVTLLIPEEGFVFSFLKSEKLGTDCARGFSDCALRLPELELRAFADDRGTGVAEVRGVAEDKFLLGKNFLVWVLLDALSPKAASLNNLS